MYLPRITRTASFRLAAAYGLLFAASAGTLGGFVYWLARTALTQQVKDRIVAEQAYLLQEYDSGGVAFLQTLIRFRERSPANDMRYRLTQPGGGVVISDLPKASRQSTGWIDMSVPAAVQAGSGQDVGESHVYRVLISSLSNGDRLSIGSSLSTLDDVSEAILTAFGFGAIGVLVLGIGGGLLLSAAFLHRVDTVTRTAEAIIAGDLSRRVQLRGSNDDFDRLAATLNTMLDRISLLMESLRQVSTDIAHDLRTPLSRLRQRLEAAQEKAHSEGDYRREVEAAIRETDALLGTFGALLRIAQVEAGGRRAGFKAVDLSAVFLEIGASFAPVVEDAGKTLELAVEPGIGTTGDRELLVQMLVNLIENAVHHSTGGRKIVLGLAARGASEAAGWVADDGVGILAEERGRVFRRFYRIEASRTSPGNGLGLALVAAVADLHGMRIRLEDNDPGLRVCLAFATVAR